MIHHGLKLGNGVEHLGKSFLCLDITGKFGHVSGRVALLGLHKHLDRLLQGTDGCRVHDSHKGLCPRQVVHRIFLIVDAVETIHLLVRSVLWNKNRLGNDNIVRTRTLKPHHVPRVLNLVLAARDQEGAVTVARNHTAQ